jgi:hypothetical protein
MFVNRGNHKSFCKRSSVINMFYSLQVLKFPASDEGKSFIRLVKWKKGLKTFNYFYIRLQSAFDELITAILRSFLLRVGMPLLPRNLT